MTIKTLKNLPKNCKVKYINNDILGYNDFKLDENGNCKKTFIPYTDKSIYSNWQIGVEIEHKRMYYMIWFKFHSDRKHIYVDHIWNGGSGKKLRRDAVSNICRKYLYKIENN